MNNDDPRYELIRRSHDGDATPEELAQLESCLREDAGFREAYVRYVNLDQALVAATKASPAKVKSVPAARFRLLQWRPAAAAAAGLLVGTFCTSLVWAMASPHQVPQVKHLLALANAGFEESVAPLPEGVPVRHGVWSGDYAEITEAQQGIAPKAGRRMLRFLRSDSAVTPAPDRAAAGNLYQVVDMRRYRAELADGQARVDWSAWFNWVPGQGETVMTYAMNVWTFAGDTSILPVNWKEHLYQETAKSGHKLVVSDAPRTWHQITGGMIVPPDTDFLVVELKAIPQEQAGRSGPYRFSGCFADDVQLLLSAGGGTRPVALSRP